MKQTELEETLIFYIQILKTYLRTFVQSCSPPIPTSIIATSTFSEINIWNARIVKNLKYGGMSWVCS